MLVNDSNKFDRSDTELIIPTNLLDQSEDIDDDDEISPIHTTSLNPNPMYDGNELVDMLKKFIENEKIYIPFYLEQKIINLCIEYRRYSAENQSNYLPPIDISYLEHSHYLFSFRDCNLSQEESSWYEARIQRLSPEDRPNENVYIFIKKLLKILSQIMIKWKLFDINHYGYRHKGRSLTVKLLNMKEINSQCLVPDIFWFSYAIKHKPFINEIPKILENYGSVLQYQTNKIFDNLREFDARLGNCYTENKTPNFELVARWKQCFGKKNPKEEENFYKNLKGVELAYRHFEKALIQEFLKII